MQSLPILEGFEWDKGNRQKNWLKHNVSQEECEEIFVNQPLFISIDPGHSNTEIRYRVLGQTNEERRLFLIFTIRNSLIRVISSRDMNKKEKSIYEKTISTT